MVRWLSGLVLLSSLVACSCGGSRRGRDAAAPIAPAPLPAIELEPLPPPLRAQARPTRQAPTISDLAGAEAALRAGHYAAVEAALGGLGDGGACLAMELHLAIARYDEAIAAAARCAEDPARRSLAETRRSEALLARGRLDEARSALLALVDRPEANRARLLLARLHDADGHRELAAPLYRRLIDAYNDESIGADDAEGLAYVAAAASALGAIRDANDAFRQATRADRERVETQREWAALFASKRDYGHAGECLREALRVSPDDPRTLAALARLLLESEYDFEGARQALEPALRIAPGLAEAHVVEGSMRLYDLDFEGASAAVAAARRTDPGDVDATTLEAAIALVRGDDAAFALARDRILTRNPMHGRFYIALASFAEWEHRYPDIVAFARAALAIDRDDASAWSLLGLHLLYEGEEAEALDALREAWRRDRYDVLVYNTLNLYDDVLPAKYGELEAAPFSLRLPNADRPVLEEALPRLLRPAYEDMVRRYGFTPQGPIRLELFESQAHFSVRTSGLPNLGVQGVCFGRVITALSPSGGPFDWGEITWHELAHVFHIQLSDHRVPRWLTEGLAEYETRIARPEWKRELDHVLVAALEAGSLPPMARMNEAFTHARSVEATIAAYHASSEIAAYLVERFGFPKVVELLRAFRDDVRFEVVAQRVLGTSSASLDADFRRAFLEGRQALRAEARLDLERYRDLPAIEARARPDSASSTAELAAARLVARDEPGALREAEAALALDATEPLAHWVRARIRLAARSPSALDDLRALVGPGRDSYPARLLLARIAHAQGDDAAASRELEAAVAVDPARPEALYLLSEIHRAESDPAARRWLERFVAVEEHDREAFVRYVALLERAGDAAAIVALAERIERVAPRDPALRLALVRALVARSDRAAARAQLAIAETLGPDADALARARALVGD